ncbi:MAG TPA: DUF4383 domain-containing protein [Chloroflexota bacterium]
MRATRTFALVFGILYIVVGLLGFVPAFSSGPPSSAPHVALSTGYRYLFGQFPVNAVHDALHILIGVIGVACSFRFLAARWYARSLFLVFGALAVLGFMPATDTLGSVTPIFGSDTWLHALSAVVAGVFGYIVSEPNVSPAEMEHAHA